MNIPLELLMSFIFIMIINPLFMFWGIRKEINEVKENKLKFKKYFFGSTAIITALLFYTCLFFLVLAAFNTPALDSMFIFSIFFIATAFLAFFILAKFYGENEKTFPNLPEPRKPITREYTWKLEVTGFYGFTSAELERKVNEYLRENNSAIVKGDATKNFEIYLTIQDSYTFDGEDFKIFLNELNATCGVNIHHLNDYQKLFTTHIIVSVVLMFAFLVILISK